MTPSLRHRLLALIVALVAAAGFAAPSFADDDDRGSGGDNAAVAINETDGSSIFEFAFDVRNIMGEVVDNENQAIAYASCQACRTVAISVQILLVSGSPDTVTPTNLAVALNEECSECQTVALAYQFVFGTGEDLRFTGRGRREIERIRRAFRTLGRDESLSDAELKARADLLADDLRTVLRTEVRTRGRDRDDDDRERVDREADDGRGRDDDDVDAAREPDAPVAPSPTQPPAETQPPPTTPPTSPEPEPEPAPETQPAPAPEPDPDASRRPQTTPSSASGQTATQP